MSAVGRVESVWRYPVKSMCGEQLPEIFASFAGVWGDRVFAFRSTATPVGFPYLTGRRYRTPKSSAKWRAVTMARQAYMAPCCRREMIRVGDAVEVLD